jgi:hypothetical protein
MRLLAVAALGGQLAAIADALFVEHVTCPEHGDRIHVTGHGPAPAAEKWSGARPAIGGTGDDHDQCLLDEDGDQAPAPNPPSLPVPAPAAASALRFDLSAPVIRGAPLYRLAPKNSPPEKSRPIV